MSEEQRKPLWLATKNGRRVGHVLWVSGFAIWTLSIAANIHWNIGYAFGLVAGYSVFIGLFCYVIALAKPLADKNLHPGIFGIVMSAIAIGKLLL